LIPASFSAKKFHFLQKKTQKIAFSRDDKSKNTVFFHFHPDWNMGIKIKSSAPKSGIGGFWIYCFMGISE